RRFYPKRLTYVRLTMYTHFTFTLMAHCTSGTIKGSVPCSRTLRQGIETSNLLITKRLLYLLHHCRHSKQNSDSHVQHLKSQRAHAGGSFVPEQRKKGGRRKERKKEKKGK